MSAWRRAAIEKIPQHHEMIVTASRPMELWVNLSVPFVRAHSAPLDEELIGQVYGYAAWCLASRDPNTFTAVVVAFYEDLPQHPEVREHMPWWLSAEEFSGMGEIFRYHLDSYPDYRAFVLEFYRERERLGAAAKQCDGAPLTDEEFSAQVLQWVTSFQEWKQKHGRVLFEFMARVYIVENKPIMEHLAPVFRGCHNAHAIATAILPVIRSLSASGDTPFPADIFTLAAAALLLSDRPAKAR
jgi:hypothetical protein